MEDERDILTLTDEDNNEIQLEVLRFFFYNGEEYAMVTELEGEGCEDCEDCGHEHAHEHTHDHEHTHEHEHAHGEDCGCGGVEVFFMRVVPIDAENEEYSFVDEELSAQLMRVIESDMDADDEEEDEEGEDAAE